MMPRRSILSFAVLLVGIAAVAYLNGQGEKHCKMAAIAPLKLIAVPALAKHTATVIFVHGLGDTGNGWYEDTIDTTDYAKL